VKASSQVVDAVVQCSAAAIKWVVSHAWIRESVGNVDAPGAGVIAEQVFRSPPIAQRPTTPLLLRSSGPRRPRAHQSLTSSRSPGSSLRALRRSSSTPRPRTPETRHPVCARRHMRQGLRGAGTGRRPVPRALRCHREECSPEQNKWRTVPQFTQISVSRAVCEGRLRHRWELPGVVLAVALTIPAARIGRTWPDTAVD
jgi:hypothetical protein